MKTNEWIARNCKLAAQAAAGEWRAPNEHKVPREWRDDHRVHIMKQQNSPGQTPAHKRQAAAQKDALSLAIHAKQQDKPGVEDVMVTEYWQYVRKYDRKYFDAVRHLAYEMIHKGFIDKLVSQIKAPIPKQPPGGPGGMGGAPPMGGPPGGAPPPMPPPMASSSPFLRAARGSGGFTYLVRRDGKPHRLLGTMGNEILLGDLAYLGTDGLSYKIVLGDGGNVTIPTGGASSRAVSLMEPLHSILVDEAEGFLSEKNIGHPGDPRDIAKAIVARARATGCFDMVPLVCCLDGPATAMAASHDVEGIEPRGEVKELKLRLGRVMAPYIERLKAALGEDGVRFQEFSDKKIPIPDDSPSPEPIVLSGEEVESSSDAKSLLMTMTAGSPPDNAAAASRLIHLICNCPKVWAAEPISEDDLKAIESVPEGKAVAMYARLARGDDAALLAAYYEGKSDPERSALIASLIASQGRRDIMDAMPELCLSAAGALNCSYLLKVTPEDERAAALLATLLRKRDEIAVACHGVIDRKAMQCLMSTGDGALLGAMLEDNQALRCFAACWLAETGDKDGALAAAKSAAKGKPRDEEAKVFACLALAQLGDEFARAAYESLRVSPATMAQLAGRREAMKYMRANRVDWADKPIPRPSEIFSSPDQVFPLARNLAAIGDDVGLLVLLRKCAEEAARGDAPKDIAAAARIAWEFLGKSERPEAAGQAREILTQFGLEFKDGELQGCAGVVSEPTAEDIARAIEKGDEMGAAIMLDRLALSDEQRALDVLRALPRPSDGRLFLELLPSQLQGSEGLPEWARPGAAAAAALPNGLVVMGGPAGYWLAGDEGSCFACKASDKALVAMMVARKKEP